jgi:hypothetical protein
MSPQKLRAVSANSMVSWVNWRDGMLKSFSISSLAVVVGGCSFYARSPEQYRDDTSNVLSTKTAELNACYDTVVKTEPTAAGKVTVLFTVEKKTGTIGNVAADPARTTAPQSLISCVVTAINGLVLNPADQRTGNATFEYDFARPVPVIAPPAPPAPPPPPPKR